MLSDLALGLAVFYGLACTLPVGLARRRGLAGAGWLLAWTIATGWTGWGYLAALGYALLATPPRSATPPPHPPSPAAR